MSTESRDSHASLQHGLVDKLLQCEHSISGQNSKVTENFAIEELQTTLGNKQKRQDAIQTFLIVDACPSSR